ncbi:MAG: zf-HC2 domain-containing protein [Deferribacteres bacterium]|nr:zf-HC2 domain-containing protein [candidate division KSB1 bacterium]MCB9508552.1 zf-HC2 domain-containing protein [Deferribacteres bacterium]
MKSTSKKWTCSDVQDNIEAYLDTALPEQEMQLIKLHVQDCHGCQGELKLAQRIQQSLRTLPPKPCPEVVTSSTLAAVRQQRYAKWRNALLHKRVWRPALAGASFLLLALLLLDRVFWHDTAPPYSSEEVALAELDVKWTIAYLGNLGKKTGVTVRDQVLEPEVVAPLQEALRAVIGSENEH